MTALMAVLPFYRRRRSTGKCEEMSDRLLLSLAITVQRVFIKEVEGERPQLSPNGPLPAFGFWLLAFD